MVQIIYSLDGHIVKFQKVISHKILIIYFRHILASLIIIINGTTAQSRALTSLTGFMTVRYIMIWVINLVLVILIQPPETSSGETTTDI
jgi:hypothetical protein